MAKAQASGPAELPREPFLFGSAGFLSATECAEWVRRAEASGQLSAVRQAASRGYAHRAHQRWQFESSAVAADLFARLQRQPGLLPATVDGMVPLGCSSNIRLYKYDGAAGDSFGPHIDESSPGPAPGSVSVFTLLVYLSSVPAGDGGRTVFYVDRADTRRVHCAVQPQQGLLLLHGHGRRCLTHEAEPLRRGAGCGAKFVLRSDVYYGPAAAAAASAAAAGAGAGAAAAGAAGAGAAAAGAAAARGKNKGKRKQR